MKKTFKFLFVLILLLFITSCDSPNETCELLGHEYEAIVTKPTCEKDGFTTYTCKYCKSSYIDDKVNAIGHEILAVEELLPTCENDGHTSGEKCTRCDYNTSVIIPALNHDVIIDEKVDPTCENTGLTSGEHCTRCDYKVDQEVIPALSHDIVIDEKVEPTCTETGLTEGSHCTRCDYKVAQEVIPALSHDIIIDEKVDPTCENTGLTKGEHCTRCDYKVAQQVIPALGHDIVIDEKVEPTCRETGLTEGSHCTRCDYKVAQQVIPALGHDIIIDSNIEPTCENTGLTKGEHCTRCDYKVAQEVIPSLGHDIVIDEKVEPTCENTGLTKGEHCTRCDYKVAQEVIPALGHDIVIDEKVDPTCESDGLTSGEHCTRCDYKVEQEVIAKLEHQYDDWYTIINPTCDSEGKDEKKCINCGNTVSRDTRITGVDNKVLVSNPINIEFFKGKTLLTIGDSITCGVGLSDAQNEYYGKLVANALGMNVVNKGISGSVYCFGGNAKTNNTLTENNVKDADIITIFLGINDFNHACKNGYAYGNPNYTSSNRSYYQVGNYESTDTSTLYGALKVWCENIEQLKLIKGFENKQFIIITPLISSWNASLGPKSWDQSKTNIHGHTLREYCTAIMRVYAEYGIPVFDANMLSGIYYYSSEDNNAVATGGDGVHINAEGHKILADSLVEFLLEGYTYENRELTNEIHEYKEITIDPTCTSNGYIKHICSKCYDVYLSDQINPLEHDVVIDEKIDPTCILTGLTEGSHCSRCNEIFVEQTIIPTTNHNYENGVCTICSKEKKPYQRITYFTVNVEINDRIYEDNAVLYLPIKYTPDKEAVKLIIFCKQGASTITKNSNPIEQVGFYNYLLNLGYAILGVDGVPDEWKNEIGICERVVGNPYAALATENAYNYIMDNYNLDDNGCFISGYSQGGHHAQNVIDLTNIPILAAAEQSPVCSMRYHQWDINASITINNVKYTKGARLNVARIFGFPEVKTNKELLNLNYDESKVALYDPWVRNATNIYTGFVQKSNLWYLPNDVNLDSITMTKELKCPIKVWCSEDDTVISADVMKVFVKAIQNAGGIAEISIANKGGHGFFQSQTPIGYFYENGKKYNTLPIAVETAEWFERFGGYSCNHSYISTVVEPTCNETGFTKNTCTACGHHIESNIIEKLGHNIVVDEKVEPTCTLTGLTEGEHCTRCNYKIDQKTIDIIDHKYQNGICSMCNISHPNMENLEGKVISIMSASTSTFKGYIPEADGFNLEHRPRYPQDNLFTDVKHTWWMQVISDFNAKLGINDSWAGSSISNISDTNNGDVGPDAAMASITRIKNLGSNGTPDLILFYGGRNDITKNYTIGTFDSSNAPTQVDLESYKWDTVVDAFICAILRIKYFYPNSELIIMLPNYNTNKSSSPKLDTLNNELEKICVYYNIKYLDLKELSDLTLHLPDGSHPDEIGMDMITDLVEKTVLEETNFQKGENIVYNVKHNLTNSLSELHYYKGVSKNSFFEEKVIADKVTIIMNGIDVTEMYYNDGLISIDNITGDIEITLTSSFNVDGHLQKLPENICHKTNIWDILEPENLYYTVNGWDLLETNPNVYSITFNVNPGDKIWATSFLEKGINGFSGNATRMTWFSDTGLLKTLDRNTVYAEFIENGYITVPDGACSVNIPMSSTIDNNEIFILNKDHIYDNLVCVCCGYEVPYEEMTLQYDDHIDISNIEIELVDENTSVITIDDKYLIASNIGSTKVYIDNKLYLITVEKAKINLVTIMGQSNAGNHFENSTSDITCSIGTAYLWGNGEGVNAKEPIDYTSSSKGFHTPLIAELYAQSVKAGNPVKNVLIWQEGITSKNGKSITYWASSVTNNSGTDATATMIKNCVIYFESNSDKYEIVGNGIYWIQGESDVSMDPVKYTSLFMAMWNDLKEAGAEYVSFLRVRKGVSYNDVGSEHKDLDYHGSLTAQLKMINDNSDMFLATSITENWIGEADAIHSVNINDYITMINTYGSNAIFTDKYNNDATISNGILTTTMKTLYGSNNRCHYGKFGAAIIGCDAAKNMYHALNNPEYKLVMADTSGMVDNKVILKQEIENQFNLSYFKNNISFRAECGSNAGILEIKVFDDSLDITDQVTSSSLNSYGTIDIVKLREYFNVKIILTYKTTSNVDIITTLTIVNDMNVLNNISTSLIEQDISI